MAKFFIHRPIFAIVIALLIVICGVIAGLQLPIAQYPQISPPTVTVGTMYTGASASVVNQTVAQIIEDQVNGTQGMDYMSSNSDDTGRYSLTVTFETGSDGDMDSVKVQNNVAVATASLPDDVKTVGVTTKKASNDMAMMVSMYSDSDLYDSTFLKNYATIYLLDKIKRVHGVGDVQIFGSDYSMRVWLNPDKLAELGLTVSDVAAAIKEQNIQAPAGTIGAMPVPEMQEKQATGKVNGRLVTPEQFGNIIVRASGDGSFVRLKDVARVETGAKTNNIIAKANGHPALAMGVQLTSDANAMQTVAAVKQVIDEARPNFPPEMRCDTIVDSTNYIRESITEVVHTFVEALLLVVLVIFVFLQSWRATLIPLLAVPVSLIGTFIALDFSINTLTLFAMVLAIGLVVDDAIVVIENVEHHMSEGLSVVDATERAMDEVQGPVVAIAFVLAAVFVPVAFLGGMMGVLYKQFALTIAISMAISAFVALSLTPALCALILKPHAKDKADKKGILDRFFAGFNTWFDKTKSGYLGIVAKMIRKSRFAVLFMILVCALTAIVYKNMPSTFVPDEDQGFYIVSVSLPPGTSTNVTQESIDKVQASLKELPGVDMVMAINGFDILSFGAKSNAGTFFVGLDPWSERTTVETNINMLIGKTFGIGAKVAPEAQVIAFNMPALPGLGMVGGWTMQLQDMSGHTEEELDAITKQVLQAMNQRPELQGVRTTYSTDAPIYNFEIDRERVKQLGVQMSDVFTALQVNFGGYQVNDFNQFGRTYKVMMQADMPYRSEVEATRFIFVKSSAGTMVPLDTLLKPKRGTGAPIISRFNSARAVQIQGNAASGYSSGDAMRAAEEVVSEVAPAGFNVEWSGQSREEKTAGSSTLRVLALCLVFVFLCLAALYESWSVPFAVLLTVPTGILGALLSEYVLGMGGMILFHHMNSGLQDSIYMQIGIIMIIGLAAKNAILIVEFAKVRVDRGMEPVKAAIEAAGLRLRPILMTSFAFIIGCLPLAVATGAGASARNGMGVAVVGGMLFATILGVFLIPVFYVIVAWISAKLGTLKQAKKKTPLDYM